MTNDDNISILKKTTHHKQGDTKMGLITWDDVEQERLEEKTPKLEQYQQLLDGRDIEWEDTAKKMWMSEDIGSDGERYVRTLLRSYGHEVEGKSEDENFDFGMYIRDKRYKNNKKHIKCEVKTARWKPKQGTETTGNCQFSGLKPWKFDVCFFVFIEPTGVRVCYAENSLVQDDYVDLHKLVQRMKTAKTQAERNKAFKPVGISFETCLPQRFGSSISWPKWINSNDKRFGSAEEFMLDKKINSMDKNTKQAIKQLYDDFEKEYDKKDKLTTEAITFYEQWRKYAAVVAADNNY